MLALLSMRLNSLVSFSHQEAGNHHFQFHPGFVHICVVEHFNESARLLIRQVASKALNPIRSRLIIGESLWRFIFGVYRQMSVQMNAQRNPCRI